jgi:hypothetical protein
MVAAIPSLKAAIMLLTIILQRQAIVVGPARMGRRVIRRQSLHHQRPPPLQSRLIGRPGKIVAGRACCPRYHKRLRVGSSQRYTAGQEVTYNGNAYKAQNSVGGIAPDGSDQAGWKPVLGNSQTNQARGTRIVVY